jgi:hypothetical protein
VERPTRFSLTVPAKLPPQYRFFYVNERTPGKMEPMRPGEIYGVSHHVRLYAREDGHAPEQFATLKHEPRGNRYFVTIYWVKRTRETGKLEVEHRVATENLPAYPTWDRRDQKLSTPPPKKRRAELPAAHESLGYFSLAGVSLGALVWRRKRRGEP